MNDFYRHLSLRYKVPIAFGVAILVTALSLSTVLSWYTYRQLRDDLSANAESISRALAKGIAPLMLRDEVWQAFENIIAPLATSGEKSGQRLVIVLDRDQRIFISSEPRTYPIQRYLAAINGEYAPVLARLSPREVVTWYQETGAMAGHIFVAAPILAEDGMHLGTVIVRFADSLFLERFHDARWRVVMAVLATLVLLFPAAWLFSRRLTEPLTDLRRRMESLPSPVPSFAAQANPPPAMDEIEALSRQFDLMQAELAKNEMLKIQVAAADRLAAIGRLAAGIAHEINNPLGGMINAINTFERFGDNKALAERTISLLKRGLGQIQETVGAMLVEARLESRAFTREDVQDLQTLIGPDASARRIALEWQLEIDEAIALPATPLRQLILNLLLNALAAAGYGGHVLCALELAPGLLSITVRNTGPAIDAERLPKLFEPYEAERGTGNGLGLWVCYQIVQQLKGTISVSSEPGVTEFNIEFPIQVRSTEKV